MATKEKQESVPKQLQRLENDVVRLKLRLLIKQKQLPTDDQALIDSIVKGVRGGRSKLFTQLYGSPTKRLR